jgi:serine/threonine-protein kinase RsbW
MDSASPSSSAWESTIPNRLDALMAALDELDGFFERHGADAQARYIARLAVEEMGTNILKYGYDDSEDHWIQLRAVRIGREMRIEVEDDGHEFDPCGRADPDAGLPLEERSPGGWGISLVRRLVAGMEYERVDGRNVLRLIVPLVSDVK